MQNISPEHLRQVYEMHVEALVVLLQSDLPAEVKLMHLHQEMGVVAFLRSVQVFSPEESRAERARLADLYR